MDAGRARRSGERARSNREDVMQLLDSLDTYTPASPSSAAGGAASGGATAAHGGSTAPAAAGPAAYTRSTARGPAPPQPASTGSAHTTGGAAPNANPTAAAAASGPANAEDAASVLAFLDEITQRSSTPTSRTVTSSAGGDGLSKRASLTKSTSRGSLSGTAPASSATSGNASAAPVRKTIDSPRTGAARAPTLADSPRSSSTTPRGSTPNPTTATRPPAPRQPATQSSSSTTVSQQPSQQQQQQQGAGGWGWSVSSVWNSASSVVAQASSVVQQARTAAEEEVKRVQAGGGIGGNLIKTLGEEQAKWTGKVGEYARPGLDQIKNTTFKGLKDLIDAVAPPIAEHEVLQVSLSHDMIGYEGVEVLVYRALSKILESVEGGTLIVNRGGGETPHEVKDDERNLNVVEGLEQGWKLAEANLDELIKKTPVPEAKQAKESDLTVPVTNTPLFMRIQPVLSTLPGLSTAAAAAADQSKVLFFVTIMSDPTNNLRHSSLSQSMPASWLDIPFEQNEWVEDAMVEIIRRSVEVIGQEYINGRMTAQESAINQARAQAQQVIDDSQQQQAHQQQHDEQDDAVRQQQAINV